MRIATICNVRNCNGRWQKYTNQFVMYMIITRYHKGWLKVCEQNEDKDVNNDNTLPKNEPSLENNVCDAGKGKKKVRRDRKKMQENNSHSSKHTSERQMCLPRARK